MSASFPTQGHHIVYMCPDVIFQIFPPCSRPIILHHVTCHVTAVSHASLLSKRKEKEKENQYKIRKIEKIKIVSVQVSHNSVTCRSTVYTLKPKVILLQISHSQIIHFTWFLIY